VKHKNNSDNKNKKSKSLIYYILIGITAFVLYGQSIRNDFNIDDDYVYENHPLVQKGISGIPEIFMSRYNTRDEQYFGYRPLTIAIYAIEYQFFGINSHSAHFFNILYYIICCLLLFSLMKQILKQKFPDGYIWISFLIVLIFQTHAIHSEVVLSIKNREEIISLIFSLIATIYALKFYDIRKPLNLIVSVLSLGLAFLAKESAIVFLILIPFIILFFKTDVKLLPRFNSKVRAKTNITERILRSSLFLWIILFIALIGNMKIIGDIYLDINIFSVGKRESIPLILFFASYATIILKNLKNEFKIQASKRNLALWIISALLLIVSIIIGSQFFRIIMMITLLLTLLKNKNRSQIKFTWIENLPRKTIIAIIAIIVLSGAVLAITYYIPKQSLPEINAPVYKWQNPSFTTTSKTEKAAVGIYSLGYYAKLMLIPYPLRFYYGYKMVPDVAMTDFLVILSLIFNVFLLYIAFKGFNKRSLLSFGILFYFIAIFPFANTLFPMTGIIAERLLFVPSIGFSLIIVFIILKLLKSTHFESHNKSLKNKSLILAAIIILPNALVSINRNPDWKNRETLYTHDIQYLENSAKANTLYANLLIGEVYSAIKKKLPINNYRIQIDLAKRHFARATEIDTTYSNPWHNLGYINMIIYKNYTLAEQQFSQSIKADSTVASSYLNRGITNYYLKKYKQSISDLDAYVNKNKNISDKEFDKAFLFTAKSKLELGDTLSATNYYVLAFENLKKENLNKAVTDDIKTYFIMVERYDLAMRVADLEISLDPNIDAPYVDKGNYYLLSGDTVKAIKSWEIAFEKFNGNFNIGITLYQYFSSNGNVEKANYYYSKANEYRQNHPTQ
jgi:tetratricopeptide (TPR) repeat protein